MNAGNRMNLHDNPQEYMPRYFQPITAIFLSAGGILAVGYLDYATGIEIRIFPLYFLPLMFAAWHIRLAGALSFSLLATVGWMLSMYFGGREYSHSYVWGINFITQGATFVIITVLFSHIRNLLAKEMASSRTDGMTGLNNSRAFYDQASLVLKLSQRKKRPIASIGAVSYSVAPEDIEQLIRSADELMYRVKK